MTESACTFATPLTSSDSVDQGTRTPDTGFPYHATGTAPAALLFSIL